MNNHVAVHQIKLVVRKVEVVAIGNLEGYVSSARVLCQPFASDLDAPVIGINANHFAGENGCSNIKRNGARAATYVEYLRPRPKVCL